MAELALESNGNNVTFFVKNKGLTINTFKSPDVLTGFMNLNFVLYGMPDTASGSIRLTMKSKSNANLWSKVISGQIGALTNDATSYRYEVILSLKGDDTLASSLTAVEDTSAKYVADGILKLSDADSAPGKLELEFNGGIDDGVISTFVELGGALVTTGSSGRGHGTIKIEMPIKVLP